MGGRFARLLRASLAGSAAALLAIGLAGAAHAQTVGLAGVLGSRALLMVDGGTPRSIAAGESYQGVKLLSVADGQALVEIGGQRVTLRLGESPASVGARSQASGTRIVMTSDSGGHFTSQGRINGQLVQFMVDTGATVMSLGVAEAERINLDYKAGQRIPMATANGMAQGWKVTLSSVRVGDVELHNMDAVIVPASMPFALLGNNFLTQFQMTRSNDQMVLERRY